MLSSLSEKKVKKSLSENSLLVQNIEVPEEGGRLIETIHTPHPRYTKDFLISIDIETERLKEILEEDLLCKIDIAKEESIKEEKRKIIAFPILNMRQN
ncbi:hypothetical protein AKJ63_00875 [candidate division MSBL1 archaeon SCGC-AAA259D18]|uniref:Uncharacterized protein n=1 Tax=candidate division MSBL1 archaeon SCGC-AAA259D18 TaxID=1698262 RepID=A0A133UCA8_9EURY|nr:hypothetical protein AKJ63_00875 [candidate division MSBL1 archaeon SCGC-AAA259D18]